MVGQSKAPSSLKTIGEETHIFPLVHCQYIVQTALQLMMVILLRLILGNKIQGRQVVAKS